MRHLSEEELILRYYGEAEGPADAEEHLAGCAACRADEEALRLTLTVADGLRVPERSEAYGSEVWARLAPRLQRREARLLRFPGRRGLLALLATAAALFAAFEAGRHWPRGPIEPPQHTASAPVRERILLVAVGDHLRRSQMVLVELVNAEDQGPLDVSAERDGAEPVGRQPPVPPHRDERKQTGVASVWTTWNACWWGANGPASLSCARSGARGGSVGDLFR
jgi:hypothetical protein